MQVRCKRCRFNPCIERSPGERNGNPLQYSCLGNPMDRADWWAPDHRVAQSRTWLSDLAHYHHQYHRIYYYQGNYQCDQNNLWPFWLPNALILSTIPQTKCVTSLAVQWLRLWASNAGGMGSIPGWGTKIPHPCSQSKIIFKNQLMNYDFIQLLLKFHISYWCHYKPSF